MSYTTSITIGDREFRRRHMTREPSVQVARLQDQLGDLRDQMLGADARQTFLGNQITKLTEGEGEFEQDRLDELLAGRQDCREQITELSNQMVTVQLAQVGVRLDPSPTAEWLHDHLDQDEFVRLVTWLDAERPGDDVLAPEFAEGDAERPTEPAAIEEVSAPS